MKIREYIPGFYSGFESRISEFNTKEELLDIDWIKCEMENNDFSGYMVDGCYLMETFNYNTNKEPSWYVIGIFDDNEANNCVKKWFPHWDTPKYVMKNGDIVTVDAWYGDKMEILVIKSTKDENLISDFKMMFVTKKWFDENYSYNIFEES